MQKLYLNKAQATSLLIDAPTSVLVYARRTGKSTQIIAHQSLQRIFDMPRGVFMLMGRTYKQLLERTLASTKTGWLNRGYVEDVHYVVSKKPPLSWPKPYYLPSSYEHTISWFNGTCFCLGSQDRAGLVNSLTVFGLYADEAKFLIEDRFKEDALPTVSAPRYYFPDHPYNRFLFLCTSMPDDFSEGEWIFNYEKLMNPDLCQAVLQASYELEDLKRKAFEARSEDMRYKYRHKAARLEASLAAARRGLVYYDERSTLVNIDITGTEYLRDQKNLLGDKFRQEILNLRPSRSAQSFYYKLSPAHFYDAVNYSLFDTTAGRSMNDCRLDSDLDPTQPLIIGMDFGVNINCIVTGQREAGNGLGFKTLKNHFVRKPDILDDVCEQWCRYYRHHPCKRMRFWYDKTGNNSQSNSKLTYAQQAQRIFAKYGWDVEMCPQGGANPRHHEKYLLINAALDGRNGNLPRLLFNHANCEELKESMQRAPAKKDSAGLFHKDKSNERLASVLPQFATHLSDAWDTMIYGEFSSCLSDNANLWGYGFVR